MQTSDGSSSLSYELVLARRNGGLVIQNESLRRDRDVMFVRDGDGHVRLRDASTGSLGPSRLAQLSMLVPLSLTEPVAARAASALAGIEVHVPFATQARWFGSGMVPDRNMRGDNIVQSTSRLQRGGGNLANALHALRNRPDWPDTLDTIRLLVDDDIADVTTPASASGGSIGLSVSYRTTGSVPAFALSDGTLALLALIS